MKRSTLFSALFFICGAFMLRGQYVSDSLLHSFDSLEVDSFFSSMGIPDFVMVPEYKVEGFKLLYNTVNPHGDTIIASGAVYLPKKTGCDYPVMNFNHGTTAKQKGVPSRQKLDVVGVIMASTGYIGILPDFMGLGDSPWPHYYMHAESEARCVIDMLEALPEFLNKHGHQWNEQLFLSGYSQGGHVAMAAHQMIELSYPNLEVTAAAPMAGPYDLSTTHRELMEDDSTSYAQPAYLPYTIFSLNEVYGTLFNTYSDILKSPYDTLLPPMFDGQHKLDAVNAVMPLIPIEIVDSSYFANYLADSLHPIRLALKANDTYRWTAQAPIRLYHCSSDEVVPYKHSQVAKDSLLARGASSVEIIDPGSSYGHQDCAELAILGAKLWFDSLRDTCSNSSTVTEKELKSLSVIRDNDRWFVKNYDSKEQKICLLDIQGRTLQNFNIPPGETKGVLFPLHSGIYFIHAKQSGEVWRLWN